MRELTRPRVGLSANIGESLKSRLAYVL